MGKKISANFEDKNRIREWAAAGKSPEEISGLVQIETDYIEKLLAAEKPKRKKKAEVTEEVNDADTSEYPN